MLTLLRLIVGLFCVLVLVVSSVGALLGGMIMLISLFLALFGADSAIGIPLGGILFVFAALFALLSGNAAKECFDHDDGKSELTELASRVKRFFTMSVWQIGIAMSCILFAVGLIWSFFR